MIQHVRRHSHKTTRSRCRTQKENDTTGRHRILPSRDRFEEQSTRRDAPRAFIIAFSSLLQSPKKTSLVDKDFYAQTRDAKNSTPSQMRTTKRVKNDTNTHTKICMIELLCDDFCLWSICTSSRRPLVLVPGRVFVRGGRFVSPFTPKGLKGLYRHI